MPPALLIAWRLLPRGVPWLPVAVACLALGALGAWVSTQQIRVAVFVQNHTLWIPPKVATLRSDEPRWVDFKEIRDLDRVRAAQRQKRERSAARGGGPAGGGRVTPR